SLLPAPPTTVIDTLSLHDALPIWDTVSIAVTCVHVCLRYNKVASLTRLMPPVIPKRRNNRLKCALTVRRAMLSWRAISALSQPRSEEHTSELQSRENLVCRLLLEK